jgi:hypothetical protein
MKKKLNKVALVVLVLLFTSMTFASNTTGEEELATFVNPEGPGADPGTTPINDYLIPMLLLGVLAGYRLTKLNLKEAVLKK